MTNRPPEDKAAYVVPSTTADAPAASVLPPGRMYLQATDVTKAEVAGAICAAVGDVICDGCPLTISVLSRVVKG